jgi:tRNA threonylcarbamoyladenosine biosynthesis protein TsaE
MGVVRKIGRVIGKSLSAGMTVALHGDLGAGKTFFIKAICEGLGVDEMVTSPTFAIVNRYHGRFHIYHIDLYRLRRREEFFDLGLDEIIGLDDNVCLVEWAERAEGCMPRPRLDVEMKWAGEKTRDMRFSFIGHEACSEVYKAIRKEAGE